MLERIRARLNELAPDIAGALLPAATEEQISALEAAVGQRLPDDLLALYRDSAGLDPDATANFAYGFSLMCIEAVVAEVGNGDEDAPVAARFADKGIRPVMTTGRQRVVIGNDASHCRICVDLMPDAEGVYGQVVFLDEEMDVALLLAPSVSVFLQQFETDLASGRYTLDADALEDGVQWLSPAREIEVGSWYNSPRWAYVENPEAEPGRR